MQLSADSETSPADRRRNKDVSVPLAVVYALEDGQILAGRIFWTVPVFLAQVGARGG